MPHQLFQSWGHNDVLPAGISETSKSKNKEAVTETGDRVLADTKSLYSMPNNKKGNVFSKEDGQQPSILENELEREQKRAVPHVAFSTYLSHELNHLSVGTVIKMDQTFINDGNGYNKYTGVFTVPTSGVYLLTYSIENNDFNNLGHHLEVELIVDNRNMGTLLAYSFGILTSKTIIRRFFFYFLVYGSSDPNFCILEKK